MRKISVCYTAQIVSNQEPGDQAVSESCIKNINGTGRESHEVVSSVASLGCNMVLNSFFDPSTRLHKVVTYAADIVEAAIDVRSNFLNVFHNIEGESVISYSMENRGGNSTENNNFWSLFREA